MSTHMPGFQPFSGFLHPFSSAKLATCSIRVNTDTGSISYTMQQVYRELLCRKGVSDHPCVSLKKLGQGKE